LPGDRVADEVFLAIEQTAKMRAADYRCDFVAAVYQKLGSAPFTWYGKTGGAEDTKIITHTASLYTEGCAYQD
jgi:hypothetical protein